MARQRSLIAPLLSCLVGLLPLVADPSRSASGADLSSPEALRAARSRPYKIRAHVSFEPATRIDAGTRLLFLDDWLDLIRRFVGDPWQVETVPESPLIAAAPLESLSLDIINPLSPGADKVWVILVRREGANLILEGREFDVLLSRIGEVHRAETRDVVNAPRTLFTLAQSLFEPLAEVGESRAGGVTFEIQGGTIPAATNVGAVAPVGSVFRAFRLFLDQDGAITDTREIPYSYFRVEERIGSAARCSIIKGIGDPLTGRYARRNRVVGLGIQPARAATRLRFLLKDDRTPAAGYKLIARVATADTTWYNVGITDRDGRVELPVNFASDLAIVRVLAGNNEPMADLPVMPGETRQERSIVFKGRPRTLDLEAKLDALQDAIIDVVANRSRLEARLKARLEGEDFSGFDATLAELRRLRTKNQFDTDLRAIRTEAENAEAELKTLILTRTARNQIDESQALIDRYLDDDPIRALVETADALKADKAAESAKRTPVPRPAP